MTPDEKEQLRRYLKGGRGAGPEEQQRLVELVNSNDDALQAPDAETQPVIDPDRGVLFGNWLGISFWYLPGRVPMPDWMNRLERRPPKVVLPCLVAAALLSLTLFVAACLPAVQAATASVKTISFVERGFVAFLGLFSFYWGCATIFPHANWKFFRPFAIAYPQGDQKREAEWQRERRLEEQALQSFFPGCVSRLSNRMRFLYGFLIFFPMFSSFGIVIGQLSGSRSGVFLVSHFLAESGGQEELFVVTDDVSRDRYKTRTFRIARLSAPKETWEVDVYKLSSATGRDIHARTPFRIWAKVRTGIPGLPTMDIPSVRLDDSIHGYVGSKFRRAGTTIKEELYPLVQLKGKFALLVYLPHKWRNPEGRDILSWLESIDQTGEVKVVGVARDFYMEFPGETAFWDPGKPFPFPMVDANSNLYRACRFIEGKQDALYSSWSEERSNRERDEHALGLFGLCLLNKEGKPVFQGDLRKKEDRLESINRAIAGRDDRLN